MSSIDRPRFSYSRGQLEAKHLLEYEFDGRARIEDIDVYVTGYCIFDKLRGHIDDAHIAFCRDRDSAEKIVAALNASVGT